MNCDERQEGLIKIFSFMGSHTQLLNGKCSHAYVDLEFVKVNHPEQGEFLFENELPDMEYQEERASVKMPKALCVHFC